MQKNIFSCEIQKEEEEIEDFHELQDYIQQYLALLRKGCKDETMATRAPMIHIYSELGACVNNIELVRDVIRKLISYLSKEYKYTSDA